MKQYSPLLLIFLVACAQQPSKTTPADLLPNIIQEQVVDSIELVESFTDSLHIGRKQNNKLELAHYHQRDTGWVTIKFFSRRDTGWLLRNEFEFEKVTAGYCEPVIRDFNNDRLNDLKCTLGSGARGGNIFYSLFLYDKQQDQLTELRYADNYPNIDYNKTLHCLDALSLTGGSLTSFLRISGDSLIKFATVEVSDGQLIVKEIDKAGKLVVTSRQKTQLSPITKFRNYKPVIVDEGGTAD